MNDLVNFECLSKQEQRIINNFREYIKNILLQDQSNVLYSAYDNYGQRYIKLMNCPYIIDDSLEIRTNKKIKNNKEILADQLWKKNKNEFLFEKTINQNTIDKYAIDNIVNAFIIINSSIFDNINDIKYNIFKFLKNKHYFVPIPNKKIWLDERQKNPYPGQVSYFIANLQ